MRKTLLTFLENVVVIVAVGVLRSGTVARVRKPKPPPDWRWLIMPMGTVTTNERRATPTLSFEMT